MPFAIDFHDGTVTEWHTTADSVRPREVTEYTPTIYVAGADAGLDDLASVLRTRGDVAGLHQETWRTAFRNAQEAVLRVDVSSIRRVRPLAGWIRRRDRPGTYRLFNVDLSPAFRYCLETDQCPAPERALRTLALSTPESGPPSAPVTDLEVDGERITGPRAVLERITGVLAAADPDVLVCDSGELVPALLETAGDCGVELELGRRPGYTQLAGTSTYESYGRVEHSPARYNVPGRVIVDESNTFFYHETNLAGCLDLVERSRKPLQELSWASIGNVLTAIQIREALSRGVLVPWKSWRHELPKTMRQLHEGDRGGFTFAPRVGLHENVHELDFSSLYPNIICTRNISPETIRCACHSDREDVPGLGYSICDDPGYLPSVLQPIIEDRDGLKRALDETDDSEEEATLSGQADALKWILVSCFGYQGFSNAKFGRIECHEAINAFAREILLEAKAALERAGWTVLHGIVDSLWVTPRGDADQEPLEDVATAITEATGIRLEYESAYDWLVFVPTRDGQAGALTKYFGRRGDGSYKIRGLACRQRSTPPFVAACQRDLLERFGETRDPGAVCERLQTWVGRLEAGVDSERLVVTERASKAPEQYDRETRATAALRRLTDRAGGGAFHPGQDVQYVVVDDDRGNRDRVRLAQEDGTDYDVGFYRERLIRAAASVLRAMGWDRDDIEAHLAGRAEPTIDAFRGRE